MSVTCDFLSSYFANNNKRQTKRKGGQHSDLASLAREQETQSEGKMTSVALAFELHFKSESLTSGTLAVLALGFILLLAWKYRKSLKHFFGYGKRTISFQSGNRKPVPEENEETNCSQVLFS